jgi:K+-transporting ATPase ATPase C chain
MKTLLRQGATMLLLFSILVGIVYPVFVTVVAQGLFSAQAQGSMIRRDGQVVGSELIGQPFDDPKYFWGRPSATAVFPYNASASNASNLGPTNPSLRDAVQQRIDALRAVDLDNRGAIPVDLVTTSASGLDPHISPAAAYFQVARIARLRGLDAARVRSLVDAHVEAQAFGLLGERRIHVLRLNLALDELSKSGA